MEMLLLAESFLTPWIPKNPLQLAIIVVAIAALGAGLWFRSVQRKKAGL